MTVWKTYRLGEICDYVTSRTANIENYISTENMLPNKGGVYTPSNAPNGTAVEYKVGDVLVSNIRPYFQKIWRADRNGACSADVLCIRANNKADSKYLYYLLSQQLFFDYVMAGAKGCKMPRGDKKQIMQWQISLPPLEEQRRIAGILGAIDDKIENNRRINSNLELQAQALYKQWFVDNRKDDWKEKPLSEIVFFQEGPGIRNWQYVEKKGVRFINIRCINDGDVNVQNANMISEDEACGKYAHFLLEPLDIVMSCSGTLGKYAIIRQEHLPLCLNTSVIRFRPAQCIEDYSFVYGYLSSAEFLNKQEEMACGSVQANFGPTHLKQIKIQVPPKDYRTKYNNVVMPIITAMLKNRTEMNMLSSLRDTLLPKLMNGEIKL